MRAVKLTADPAVSELIEGFRRIRRGMGLPEAFPAEVQEEAERVAGRKAEPGPGRADRTEIDLISIDPPGSMDLDQAYAGERTDTGYRIHSAIADLGHFVDPGGALETESIARGLTLYSPDTRTPLYPPVLGEGAASLLPEQERPAALWTFQLDRAGWVKEVKVERALVRSRRRMTYAEAQQEIDSGASGALQVLKEVGIGRLAIEAERGGVDLRIPDQQIARAGEGYELEFRVDLPVERWNAQISLMTGIAAASLMLRRGAGLLRTLPAPSEQTLAGLRASASLLGVEWPQDLPYQSMVRRQDPARPRSAAMLTAARVLFRGAGYHFFSGGETPGQPNHYAVAAPYAHVTAPLRRLCDRLSTELLLCGEGPVPQWLLERLAAAPEVMKQAERRSRELESKTIDFVEAQVLAGRLGEDFEAVVVQCGARQCLVQLTSPAVLATAKGEGLQLGERVQVRLTSADPVEGKVAFEHVAG